MSLSRPILGTYHSSIVPRWFLSFIYSSSTYMATITNDLLNHHHINIKQEHWTHLNVDVRCRTLLSVSTNQLNMTKMCCWCWHIRTESGDMLEMMPFEWGEPTMEQHIRVHTNELAAHKHTIIYQFSCELCFDERERARRSRMRTMWEWNRATMCDSGPLGLYLSDGE